MENQNNIPQAGQASWLPPVPIRRSFPTGGNELALAGVLLVLAVLQCNSIFYGGFNLGYAVTALLILAASVCYLLRGKVKITPYPAALLVLAALIMAGFARSNDSFVKFVLFCFLSVAVNVSFSISAGLNRFDPAGIGSLLDAPVTLFGLGLGRLEESFRGLSNARKNFSGKGKAGSAVLLGLVIAVPILAVMIPLLMSADAAFDGLLSLLPEFEFSELFLSVTFGAMLAPVLYTRCAALVHVKDQKPRSSTGGGKLNPITVITVISAVCAVYLVYLFSQLAYFVGGFSGILPAGYTLAQYARRGFFEMAALCGINLGLIALAVGLVEKKPRSPLPLRLLCLFIGLITMFMVVSASAKMVMYIGGYGLTRLRVLTEVIMVFLGLATALVCAWLFREKLPYMKILLIIALVIGAAVLWIDVDTVVAKYNVEAYQSGKLETVDVWYLASLSDGAVPYLQELAEDPDPQVREAAVESLSWSGSGQRDLRSWNYASAQAEEILEQYKISPAVDMP